MGKQYIDADKLLRDTIYNPNHVPYIAESDIIFAPKADVVEVVWCKDCKHNSLKRVSGNAFCELGIGLSQIYDFCSKGERREDE